jgi:hypothetical protein
VSMLSILTGNLNMEIIIYASRDVRSYFFIGSLKTNIMLLRSMISFKVI